MKNLLAACLLVSTAAIPAFAQQTSEQRATERSLKASPPTLTASYGTADLQKGQLRIPEGKGPFPVAVIVHGGCWSSDFGSMESIAAVPEELTKRGIATWNITYRRNGNEGGGYPGTFEDVAAGVDYLTELAKTHPLDLSRVTFVGHSAGAHLAAWAASRAKLDAKWAPKVKPVSLFIVDGPATLAPFVGLDAQVCGRPVIAPFMGGTPAEKPAEYKFASPADHLPLGIPQYMVQGMFTPFMGPYAEGAKASGDKVEVLQTDPKDHFDMVTPGTPNGDKTIDFIATRAFAKP